MGQSWSASLNLHTGLSSDRIEVMHRRPEILTLNNLLTLMPTSGEKCDVKDGKRGGFYDGNVPNV